MALTDTQFSQIMQLISAMFTAFLAYLINKLTVNQRVSERRATERHEIDQEKATERQEIAQEAARILTAKLSEVKHSVRNSAQIEVLKLSELATEDTLREVANKMKEDSHKLDALGRVAATTHILVNSRHGRSLRRYAIMSRRYAELTGDPNDAKVADNAEREADEHDKQQMLVDLEDAKREAHAISEAIPQQPTSDPDPAHFSD